MAGPGQPTEGLCLLNMVVGEELVGEEAYQGLSQALKFQAAARCSSSLPIAATARRHNSASQAGSSPTESLLPVTTTRRSITEGSFEQWKRRPLKKRRRAWFHFQLLHRTVRD